MAMTNFYCLKWGTKYGPQYVNRLFNSLKVHYDNPFSFTCLTDDSSGFNSDIIVDKIPTDFNEFPRTQIFTSEKMCYFNTYKHISNYIKTYQNISNIYQKSVNIYQTYINI